MTAMLTIARFTLLEAVRGRVAWLVAAGMLAGYAFAAFAGEIAITETRGVRGGLLGAWLRASAVFTVAVFVTAGALRELQDKGLELLLSMPVTRGAYCVGKLVGFGAVAALSAAACALVLAWLAPPAQVALWAASLGLELLIVTAMSLLCVFTFSRITWALGAVMGFYVLSRAMGALQLMAGEVMAGPASLSQRFIAAFVDALAFVLPDLGRFTESTWLIHGDGTMADLGFAAAQAVVYVPLLMAAALFDLYRKAL